MTHLPRPSSVGFCQLLAMVGEQFDHGDDICGAVVNVRTKQEKISIWTKNGLNEASQVYSDSFLFLPKALFIMYFCSFGM